jgi:ABC-2 type transport system permease protein
MACIVKTRERFMGVGQFLTMPIFFASNAIYPITLMPGWLRAVVRVNPLSYQVDALRRLMLAGGHSQFGLAVDFAALAGGIAVVTVIATHMYPRLTQ